MAIYTTTIRSIIESYATTDKAPLEQLEEARPHIFDFAYPIFDESHRRELETKILLHYFNREIGLETVGLWKLYLNERLNLEMPFYNQLYEIEANKFDYLINVDTMQNSQSSDNQLRNDGTTSNRTTTDSGKDVTETHRDYLNEGSGSDSSNSGVINSDFPQATYGAKDYASGSQQSESSGKSSDKSSGDEETVVTANYGKVVTEAGNGSLNSKIEGKSEGSVTNTGTSGSKTQLMLEYRNAVINIDKMIVESLADLFMTIY